METGFFHLPPGEEGAAFDSAGLGDLVRASLDPALTRPAPHHLPT
ncbi:hypothetical protein GCM10023081_42110 [Arthrobacter ginkgonis]|uniref:Uncharacterized protein n=1 Tax=Arthrobacter ginkgonis TaxID=1630594 RepID=A0ABP7DB66_9MICC